jgi:fermentation-respiration switch protein FrsA (DUF1100 family)
MKKTAIIAALSLACVVGAFGQGKVNFSTRVTGSIFGNVNAPVYGVDPAHPSTQVRGNSITNGGAIDYGTAPLLTGTGFTAALFGGPAGMDETIQICNG